MSMSNYDLYRGGDGGGGEGIRTRESEPVINHLIAPLQESLNANNLTFTPLSLARQPTITAATANADAASGLFRVCGFLMK